MAKIAFLFPGQGSQYVGMGKNFYDSEDSAKDIYLEANRVLNYDLAEMCFNGPEEDLKETINTQPAILTTSIACLKAFAKYNIVPDYLAGHSLGEYAALVAAGCIEFKEAVTLVRARGQIMENACPEGSGMMLAVLGLDTLKIEEICNVFKEKGVIQIANYNCPGQIVVSGESKVVESAMQAFKEAGAKRVIPLQVSGPFHSELMRNASLALEAELKKININDAKIPVIANYNAHFIQEKEEIEAALLSQIYSSVQWEKSILNLVEKGVDTFIEIGPGKVLTGLVKKIAKDVAIYNIQDRESLSKTLESIRGDN